MPTERCHADCGSVRCPGVFSYDLRCRTATSVGLCPLCGAPHRWDPALEEWVVEAEVPPWV